MASAAANGDAAAAAAAVLDNLKPPSGIIIPPPGEVRETIEKTAGYVMRGGPGLEERIRENHGDNPKFSFLMDKDDPYNAFYQWRKQEIKGGRGTDIAAGRVGEAAAGKQEPKGPEKPPPYQFTPRMPRMTQKDLDVLRLAALFVAKNGPKFKIQLTQREASNPQFPFLMPNHTFYNFFQDTVEQYSTILRQSGASDEAKKAREARVAQLQQNVDNRFHIVARARQRIEYAAWLEKEKERLAEEEEQKRIEFASIDWNNFVVVETIVFADEDEWANLPPPTNLNNLEYASLEEKNKRTINANMRLEEAFPYDDSVYKTAAAQTYGPRVTPAEGVNLQEREPGATPLAVRGKGAQDGDAGNGIQEDGQGARIIQEPLEEKKVKEYVPRALRQARKLATQVTICPNCKQTIPVNEIEEHMKIELQDPRWKEQKAKAESRYGDNFAGADMADNLKRLASQRSDVFDSLGGMPISDEPSRKRVATGATGDGAAINVEDQIRKIQSRFFDRTGKPLS